MVAAVLLASAPVLLAQSGAGRVDLRGVWTQGGNVGFAPDAGADTAAREIAAGRVPRWRFTREDPPVTEWGRKRLDLNRETMMPNELGRNERNALLYPYCLPEGMPRMMTIGTFEIIYGNGVVYLINERNHNIRRIYVDGKRHLEGMAPTFLGTSHGRWEGDSLFVETANIDSLNGWQWLDTFGDPMSDKLRVEERFRRLAADQLQVEFLFDDPEAYTRPWKGTKVYTPEVDEYDMTENITCSDHLREDFVNDMKSGNYRGKP